MCNNVGTKCENEDKYVMIIIIIIMWVWLGDEVVMEPTCPGSRM